MKSLLSKPEFLVIYSGVLTIVFVLTVVFAAARGAFSVRTVSAAGQGSLHSAEFDQITVHRINIVEPDGTQRLILSDKAEFPGSLYHGREIARPDRTDSAGMLFINDEGTENGGLLIGGYKGKDGTAHSWGHLSFDEYDQDQTLALDTSQDGDDRDAHYQISDNGDGMLTPEAMEAFENARRLPASTPEERIAKQQARATVIAKYGLRGYPRAELGRERDKSVGLRLKDASGHDRILIRVAPDGTPSMEFLDAGGHVTQHWPEK
jgi:hypothetical protein